MESPRFLDPQAFEKAVLAEWHRASRGGNAIAAMAVAIDGDWIALSGELDLFGHARLEAVTRAVMAGAGRAEDLVMSGSRGVFDLLLPDADVPGALAVAQSILSKVRLLTLSGGTFDLEVLPSVSIGFASAFPTQLLGPEELHFRARSSLKQAQAAGGNTWKCSR